MVSLVLVCALAFGGGGILGKCLAVKGINSDNALKNYQNLYCIYYWRSRQVWGF